MYQILVVMRLLSVFGLETRPSILVILFCPEICNHDCIHVLSSALVQIRIPLCKTLGVAAVILCFFLLILSLEQVLVI